MTGSDRVVKRLSSSGYRGFFKTLPTSSARQIKRWSTPKNPDCIGLVIASNTEDNKLGHFSDFITVLWDGEVIEGSTQDFLIISSQ